MRDIIFELVSPRVLFKTDQLNCDVQSSTISEESSSSSIQIPNDLTKNFNN